MTPQDERTADAELDECIHGLGPVAACVICNGRAASEAKPTSEVAYTFRAKFGGRLSCGHEVDLGELIYRMADERLICEDCAP